ncbi:MAG: surface-adhesin E family protein [Thermodesulfobacteriota bacterium]
MKPSQFNKAYFLLIILSFFLLGLVDAQVGRAEDWQFVGERPGRGKIYVDKESISRQPAGTLQYKAKIYVEGERKASMAKAIGIELKDPKKGQALDHVICEIEIDCATSQDKMLSIQFLDKSGKEILTKKESEPFMAIGPDQLSQAIKAMVCGSK